MEEANTYLGKFLTGRYDPQVVGQFAQSDQKMTCI